MPNRSPYLTTRVDGGVGPEFHLSPEYHPGNVFFVDSGHANAGDSSGKGQTPDAPFATLDYAIGQCTANNGDKVLLMPGHSESPTSVITLDVAGIHVKGLGHGTDRPEFTIAHTGDGITITASDCIVENLYFNENATGAGINLNIAAARTLIKGCHFDLGANEQDCITVTASGDDSCIEECTFRVTANGPDSAITVEGAADNLQVKNCLFDGGSTTNVFDDAHIDLGSTTPTNVHVSDCVFAYGTAFVSTGATPKLMNGNRYVRGCRPIAGVPIDIHASSGVTGTKSGDRDDPTTIDDAVSLASAGDRILLYPGTYTVGLSAWALNDNNVTIQPYDYVLGERADQVELANDTADVATFVVTGTGVTIQGIRFTKGTGNTSDGTPLLDIDASRCTVRDCILDLEARANADGINLATATKDHLIERNLFTSPADGKSLIAWACSSMVVRDNVFDCSAADAIMSEQLASPGDGNAFVNNIYIGDDTGGSAATWQSSPGAQYFGRNRFASVGAANVLGDDADLDEFMFENWIEGSAGDRAAIDPSAS